MVLESSREQGTLFLPYMYPARRQVYSLTVTQPMGLGERRGGHDSTWGGEEGFLEENKLDLTG